MQFFGRHLEKQLKINIIKVHMTTENDYDYSYSLWKLNSDHVQTLNTTGKQ